MPPRIRWGAKNLLILIAIQVVFFAIVGGIEYVVRSDPSALKEIAGGVIYAVILLGGLMLVVAVPYLALLWLTADRSSVRLWAFLLSPLLISPALLDAHNISQNPLAIAYWLVPAAAFALLVIRPPHRDDRRTQRLRSAPD